MMTDTFATHIFIEFYYRYEKRFLSEHNSKLTFRELNESYGVFDGCEVLSKRLYDRIIEARPKDGGSKVITLTLKNYAWIDSFKIRMYTNKDSIEGANYLPSSKILFRNGKEKFFPLEMSVNLANKRLLVSIMHELTHAYEDYNRRTKGKESLDDRAKEIGYYKNINVGNYEGEKKYLSYILYYLTDFEVNAHLSQLKGELQACDEYFSSIQEVVDFLRKTDVYKRYKTVKTYVDFFSGISDTRSQATVMKWIGEISDLKFINYQRFIDYINKRYEKVERHMNRNIPKIAYEYLQCGGKLCSFDGEMPELEILERLVH